MESRTPFDVAIIAKSTLLVEKLLSEQLDNLTGEDVTDFLVSTDDSGSENAF